MHRPELIGLSVSSHWFFVNSCFPFSLRNGVARFLSVAFRDACIGVIRVPMFYGTRIKRIFERGFSLIFPLVTDEKL